MNTRWNGWRRAAAPALTLLVLSPIVVELLFGSTYITIISALIPETAFYGGAAIIIRYLVRRRHRGWVSILLLGMAFAIFEEFLVVQTSVSPALFVGVSPPDIYGRMLGVNWVYLLWAVGYESVWGIVLPIYLTELIFPERRGDMWLGRLGAPIIVAVFILGSVVSWYFYTQVVAPDTIGSTYSPPWVLVIFATTLIAALGVAALGPRPAAASDPAHGMPGVAPHPWCVGVLVFVVSLLWFGLVAFAFNLFPTVPAAGVVAAGLVLAGTVLFLVKTISARIGWGDTHRLAMIFGGLAAGMLAGFWASGIVLAIDLIGKLTFDVIALILLFYLARRLRDHSRREGAAGSNLVGGSDGDRARTQAPDRQHRDDRRTGLSSTPVEANRGPFSAVIPSGVRTGKTEGTHDGSQTQTLVTYLSANEIHPSIRLDRIHSASSPQGSRQWLFFIATTNSTQDTAISTIQLSAMFAAGSWSTPIAFWAISAA